LEAPNDCAVFRFTLALELVDMRLGFERLGGVVRERMALEPRTRALFAFICKRGHMMKVLTWEVTGIVLVRKSSAQGSSSCSKPTRVGDQHIVVSDAIFDVIFKGVRVAPKHAAFDSDDPDDDDDDWTKHIGRFV
jgi:transposase